MQFTYFATDGLLESGETRVTVEVPSGYQGTERHEATGTVTLLAADADIGEHRFTYRAGDGENSATSQLVVTVVEDVPTRPVPTPDFVRLEAGQSAQLDLLENDTVRVELARAWADYGCGGDA